MVYCRYFSGGKGVWADGSVYTLRATKTEARQKRTIHLPPILCYDALALRPQDVLPVFALS